MSRCEAVYAGVSRCELESGHDGQHTGHMHGGLLHWNPGAATIVSPYVTPPFAPIQTYRIVVACPDCGRSHIEIGSHPVDPGFVIQRPCHKCNEVNRSAFPRDEGRKEFLP